MAYPIYNPTDNLSIYYNVLNFFKNLMNGHPSIEFVTQGDLFEIDTKEFPTYPFGNVFIDNVNFGENYTDYSIQLIVASKQKYKANESEGTDNEQTIPFLGEDDTQDILANTLAILNDLTAYVQRGVEGMDVLTDAVCTPFKDRFDNGLAGWSCVFNLRVHNNRDRCLFNYFDQTDPTITTTTTSTTTTSTTTTTTTLPFFEFYSSNLVGNNLDSGDCLFTETKLQKFARISSTLNIPIGTQIYTFGGGTYPPYIPPVGNQWIVITTIPGDGGGIENAIRLDANGIVIEQSFYCDQFNTTTTTTTSP